MSRLNFIPAPRKAIRLIARNPVYQAFAARPMPASLQRTQSIDARLAYSNTLAGTATRHDRETLQGVANCVMVLAEKHCADDDLACAKAAQHALLRTDGRVNQGKARAFDGPGRIAVLACIELFEDMAARLGQGLVTEALVTVLERVQRGQVYRHDVANAELCGGTSATNV